MSGNSAPEAPAAESPLAPEAPYRGLLPYSERDAALFFGRQDERDLIVDNMMASRLTLLYGASGVGKTSLLRAGVTHELLASARANVANYGAPEFVVVYHNRWSDDPVASLLRNVQASVATVVGRRVEAPRIGSTGLVEAMHAWTTAIGSDLLIILDQFEEYFLYHPDDHGEGSFAEQFPRVVNRPDLRVSFLVAIREDALARLDRFKGGLPNLFDNYLRTRHLDDEAARAAIEKPLEAYNRLVAAEEPFTAEPELVQAVLDQIQIGKVVLGVAGRGMVERRGDPDAAGQGIETPYLQLVLTRLWREEVAAGSRVLRAETLRRLGGAQQIVHTHLDEALRALPAREQDVAARVFHHLVTPSGTKIAHTAPDLADYAQLPLAEVSSVLEELSGGDIRILRPVRPRLGQPGDDPAYEIFHDVLAPAILDWRTRHTEARAAEARLASTIRRGAERTRAAEARATRYREWLRRGGIVGMVVLIVLLTTIAILARKAQLAALDDQRQLQRGLQSSQLATQALKDLPNDPASSLRLAVSAFSAQPSTAAEYALRQALSQSRVRVIMRGHRDSVTSAAYSPDGRQVLSASTDGTVALWDAATGRRTATLQLDSPSRHFTGRPRFSHDGRLVLATSRSSPAGRIYVWPARAGGRAVVLSSRSEALVADFSPDASLVVSGHDDGVVRLWNWRTSRKPVELGRPGGGARVVSVAFSPAGDRVAAGDADGDVRVWPLADPDRALTLRGHSAYVNEVAFSPRGTVLATASDDTTARLWDLEAGGAMTKLAGHDDWVTRVVFAPDGARVVTGSVDETARVWDAATGRQVAELRDHDDEVLDVAVSPDGAQVATASGDTARVFELETGDAVLALEGRSGMALTAQFAPDGRSLVTASVDGTLRTWSIASGQTLRGHHDLVNGAALSPDGRHVATAGEDGTARVWRAATGRQVAVLRTGGGVVNDVSFSRDGRAVITAGADADGMGIVQEWRWETGATRVVLTDDGFVNSARPSADGALLAIATDLEVQVWDRRRGQARATIAFKDAWIRSNPLAAFSDARLSPDGRVVLTAQLDRTARLWDARTGRPIRVLAGRAGTIESAAFDGGGRMVVTASDDGTAGIWDAASGKLVQTLISPSGELSSAAFSSDGRKVVAGGMDGRTEVWDVASGQVLATLRQHGALVNSAVFSREGTLILTASNDGTAKLYPCDSCGPAADLPALARQRLAHLS